MSIIRNALVAAIVALSAPAFAGDGGWSNMNNEPQIYQTNTPYGPTTVPALNGVPTGAVITTVNYAWGYYASPYGADPVYTLQALLCGGSKCGTSYANNNTGTSTTGTTFWANQPGNSTFTFTPRAVSSAQKVFVQALGPSRQFQVSVTYSF